MRISLVVSLVAALVLGGCAFHWEKRTTATTRQDTSPVRLAQSALPGRAELGADGVLRFTLDRSGLCQQDRLTVKRRTATKRYGFSGAGKVILVSGLVVGVGGGVGAATTDEPAPLIGVAVAGVMTAGVLTLIRYAAPHAPRKVEDTGDWPVVDGTDVVPCSPEVAAEYASLSVVTPWNASSEVQLDADGIAAFAIDWMDVPAPTASDARVAVSAPWTIQSRNGALVGTYTPSAQDVEQILAFGELTRDRVVVGATLAALQIDAFQVEGAGLTIGAGGLLTVTVSNAGESTAVDVVARTRSTLKALDGLTFALGKIQPGRSATAAVTVKVPAKTSDDQVLVRLLVTTGDQGPIETTLTIPLSRTVCPAGGLTREAYDAKRDRLKAARDAGAITAAEFEQYDAALLACLP